MDKVFKLLKIEEIRKGLLFFVLGTQSDHVMMKFCPECNCCCLESGAPPGPSLYDDLSEYSKL
jgi:hypothetical protein